MEINNNIMESYCSFEVSKLLKEKGFNVYSLKGYDVFRKIVVFQGGQEPMRNTENYHRIHKVCTAPTHTLGIEWIRVNFRIWIYVDAIPDNEYSGVVIDISNRYQLTTIGVYTSPQEATEAALLYTLKNI